MSVRDIKRSEQFNSILSSVKDSIFVISKNYIILFMNEHAYQQFEGDLVGKEGYDGI